MLGTARMLQGEDAHHNYSEADVDRKHDNVPAGVRHIPMGLFETSYTIIWSALIRISTKRIVSIGQNSMVPMQLSMVFVRSGRSMLVHSRRLMRPRQSSR